MKDRNFSTNNVNIPNSMKSKKEEAKLIRVSSNIAKIIKYNAFNDEVTMKDYVEKLVMQDNEKRIKNKEY